MAEIEHLILGKSWVVVVVSLVLDTLLTITLHARHLHVISRLRVLFYHKLRSRCLLPSTFQTSITIDNVQELITQKQDNPKGKHL